MLTNSKKCDNCVYIKKPSFDELEYISELWSDENTMRYVGGKAIFKEHRFTLWGTHCKCGNECSILQNESHPWDDTIFTVKLKCNCCNNEVVIDNNSAAVFYNNKIHSYFNNLYGKVIDLGCGGGFLSRHLMFQENIDRVFGLDINSDCINELADIIEKDKKFEFLKYDVHKIGNIFSPNSIDFLVSRDVFMFIEDTDQYFDDVSKIVNRGIKQMGWYIESNNRMKNKLRPQQIAEEYRKRGWIVELEYLDWYKSGYFINAYKPLKKDNNEEK